MSVLDVVGSYYEAWMAGKGDFSAVPRSEEHTSELQSHVNLVCRLLLEKKNTRPLRSPRRPATPGIPSLPRPTPADAAAPPPPRTARCSSRSGLAPSSRPAASPPGCPSC